MNIEIANRLVQLRKQKGYSQEQLADALGVSRQAVSKWETAAASPDTDNLICLAKLYGVSLDELLGNNVEQTNTESTKPEEHHKDEFKMDKTGIHVIKDNDEVHIGFSGIHVINKNREVCVDGNSIKAYTKHNKARVLAYTITSVATLILATLSYLLLGFYVPGAWSWAWVLFLALPFFDSLLTCFFDKKCASFDITSVCTTIYILIGMLANIWHPSWVVFLFIPLFYSIAIPIDMYVLKPRRTTIKPSEFVIEHNDEKETK